MDGLSLISTWTGWQDVWFLSRKVSRLTVTQYDIGVGQKFHQSLLQLPPEMRAAEQKDFQCW